MNDAPPEVTELPGCSSVQPAGRKWKVAAISIVLVALVFVVFGQSIRFGFVNLDDLAYAPEHPIVSKGLSLAGIGWAFTHVHCGLWQPMTVMLLMLDTQMFGSWAGGFHLVNVLLHAACVVLLFRLLLTLTGAFWRSGFVAAVFAIHPLRAESVIWITECKDVLSGVFFMLTLLAYVRYARGPRSVGRYAMVLLWFGLGLMSKSMLVTVPGVLLLLDYWPLGRLRSMAQLPGLIWEKIPLIVLSALSCVATILAISAGKHAALLTYPASAPIAYVIYIGKLIYPSHLALPYPIPRDGWPAWQLAGALLVLTVLTAGAWISRRKQPFLITGWLWYLGMLVPVIRAMQTDYPQAYADRFTYLPEIGLCIAGTWLAADWAERRKVSRGVMGGCAGVILCALLIGGSTQVRYWRSSVALWSHTLECTGDNYYAHYILGDALYREGHVDDACEQFRESIQIAPDQTQARVDLASILLRQGRIDDAVGQLREAVRSDPRSAGTHYYFGNALLRQGRLDEAREEFHAAVGIDPSFVKGLNEVGNALLQKGRADDGIAEYRAALNIDPTNATLYANLGNALFQQGKREEGIDQMRKALALQPGNQAIQSYLARMLAAGSGK